MKRRLDPQGFALPLALLFLFVGSIAVFAGGTTEPAEQAKKVTIRMQVDEYNDPQARPEVTAITKELIAEYMKLHPNVTLVLGDYMPIGQFYTWFATKMAVRDAPEFVYSLRVQRMNQKGWWIPLDEYLREGNPYVAQGKAGHDKWSDILPDWVWEGVRHPDGRIYETPLTITGGCTLYYNKGKFKDMGLTTEWKTWTDFLNTSKTLKNAGIGVGIYMGSGSSYRWIESVVLTAFFADKGKDMLLPQVSERYSGKWKTWRTLEPEELSKAIYEKKVSAMDPRFREYLRVMKDLSGTWIDGYATLSRDEAYNLFGLQKIILGYYGLFSLGPLKTVSSQAGIDFGVVQVPPVTKEISQFVTGETYITGGAAPNDGFGITAVAEDKGIVKECIDFLKFWSAPENFGRLSYVFPSLTELVGAKMNPELIPFRPVFDYKTRLFDDYTTRLGPKAGDQWLKVTQDYFAGVIDEAAAQTEFQKIMDDAVKALADQYKWAWYQ